MTMAATSQHWTRLMPPSAREHPREKAMHVIGFDHMVVNTHDLEQALHFYRDVLGLELLRLEAFRAGNVGFVSARVAPETIIDIRPIPAGERVTPNMDHYCLVLRPTDMHQLHASCRRKASRWRRPSVQRGERRGMVSSSNSGTPMGTKSNSARTRTRQGRKGP